MCTFADLACQKFGLADGQLHGYPGHQEIELALIKLYRVTDRERYLETADYFIRERPDAALHMTCKTLFDNIVLKKMHITGRIDSSAHGGAFCRES